jgi:hypothetical protein
MTVATPTTLDTSYFQDGQPAGSITPSDARVLIDSLSSLPASGSPQTGASYTAQLADRGTVVEMNAASSQTFLIPTNASVAFDIGTVIGVYQMGVGSVTIQAVTPGTTTIRPTSSVAVPAQYSTVFIRKRAADEWVVS